ncbi:MAG: hypothetical protein HYR98_00160 [Nitrospirae bacterium]|nr:hypothetical protein [Nitrospirota bacterium]MBI3392953.1 hypothetical protein [Nitrospirota bacterium]
MKAVTLRNIPPQLARVIRNKARAGRQSINKAVLGLLEERTGVRGRTRRVVHHDLDSLVGSWSKEEAAGFRKALARQRSIDAELWK